MTYHVYVTVSGEDRIAHYAMDRAEGGLSPLAGIELEGRPAPIAVDLERLRMHVARRSARQLSTLEIDGDDGSLALMSTVPLETDPCYIGLDRSARFLLSAHYMGATAGVHRIGDDGAVTHPPVTWERTAIGAHCFRTDPSNRFAFVPHIAARGGPNAVFQFRFDPETGALTPNAPARVAPSKPDGPRHFCFHPELPLLYFSNEQGSGVTVQSLDAGSGTLSPVQRLSTLPEGWQGENTCAQIRMTPDGRYLYVANRGHDSIARFAVHPDRGYLSPLGHTPAEAVPRVFAIDPSGRFLLSAGFATGRMIVFAINPSNGELTRAGLVTVGDAPMWIEILDLEAERAVPDG